MNVLLLVGRLTRDPEIQNLDGKKNCHITLAVGRPFKNPDGLYETDFINITIWNVVAEKICDYCKKGDIISVKGRIQNNNYTDKNDNKVYTYEIIADNVAFMKSGKNKDDEVLESQEE